jgi:hypothetical protein
MCLNLSMVCSCMHNFGSKLHKLSFLFYLCNSNDHDFNLGAESHLEPSQSFLLRIRKCVLKCEMMFWMCSHSIAKSRIDKILYHWYHLANPRVHQFFLKYNHVLEEYFMILGQILKQDIDIDKIYIRSILLSIITSIMIKIGLKNRHWEHDIMHTTRRNHDLFQIITSYHKNI